MTNKIHIHIHSGKAKTADAEWYSQETPAAVAHIKSLADRVKSAAGQNFSKKGAAKEARCLTDAIDALLYERD